MNMEEMELEEMEFNERKTIYESFKSDLKAVVAKYGFERKEHDQYNGSERYIGFNVYYKINGEPYYNQTLAELIEEVFGEIGLP